MDDDLLQPTEYLSLKLLAANVVSTDRGAIFMQLAISFICLLGLVACGTGGGRVQSLSAIVEGRQIAWRDFLQVSEIHRSAFDVPSGESIYMFTNLTPQVIVLSDGRTFEGEYCHKLWTNSGSLADQTQEVRAIYAECQEKVRASKDNIEPLSLGEFVWQSEQAVRLQGDCEWLGYDARLDMRARSIGALASSTDNRLFFARLRCR